MEFYEEFNKFVVKEPSELDNLDLKKCYARLVISKIMVTISSFFSCLLHLLLLHRILIQLFRHRPLDHYPFLLLLSYFDQSYFHLSLSSNNKEFYVPPQTTAKPGSTITWNNEDSAIHTATSGRDATPDGKFDTSLISPGQSSKSITMPNEPGEYSYFCRLHPWMTGTVEVQ
jgi:hypothetical protein